MKTLRLLLFEECDRKCKGCCNEQWDLEALPECHNYTPYDEIILTGGEPLLYPEIVEKVVKDIRKTSSAKIYLYTAKLSPVVNALAILAMIDGITFTLHSEYDIDALVYFSQCTPIWLANKRSLHLNVFRGIDINLKNTIGWKIKKDIVWTHPCPLPENETLMRLER